MLQAVSCFTVPRAIVMVPGSGRGPRSVVVAVVVHRVRLRLRLCDYDRDDGCDGDHELQQRVVPLARSWK